MPRVRSDGVRAHWDAECNIWMALDSSQSTFTSHTAGNQAVRRNTISLEGAVPSLKVQLKSQNRSDSAQTLPKYGKHTLPKFTARASRFLIYSRVETEQSRCIAVCQHSTTGIRESGLRENDASTLTALMTEHTLFFSL